MRNDSDWKWHKSLDTDDANALLTDLSNPFDGINHESLVTNLNVCALYTVLLKFIYPYLMGRIQTTNINFSYSFFAEILFGVAQGSALWTPIFNAYTCDPFYDIYELDLATFADDNTPYPCLSHMVSVLGNLKGGIDTTFDLFTKKIS